MPPSLLGGLLALRLERLLDSFATGIDDDLQLLQQLEGSGSNSRRSSGGGKGDGVGGERLLLAVRCRASKKRVLMAALQAMQPK